jgi:hypothetical protein
MAQFRIRSGRCIALVVAAGLAVAGCEREDAAGDALNTAHVKLASLSPFGTTLPAGDYKLKTYREVIDSLKGAVSDGTPTQSASASLLIAQAEMGLAEPAAAKAAELERGVLEKLSAVRMALGHYMNFTDSARAAASYDPAKDIAEIEKQDKEKSEQITAEGAAKAAIEKQAADLQAQARGKSDGARAKRQEAGSLRQKVAGQTAVEGEKTLLQWQKLAREADALEVEAAQLEAEAAKVAPRAGEVQNTIERLTKQRELLAAERTEVGRRTQVAKEQSSQLQAEAAKTADEIKKLTDEIHGVRTGELSEQTQKATSDYAKAAGTAAKAGKELKGSAQMVVGAARQALGETLLSRGRGLKVYAQVLDSVVAAKVPGADGFKAQAEEARAAAKESFDQAFEAYQQADTAYNGAGAKGEAKTRLEKLNAKFIELIEVSGGSKDLISSRAQPEEATPTGGEATPSAAAATADQSTPQGTLQMLIDIEKSGNYATMGDLFLTNSDAERQAIQSAASFAPKFKKLDDAVKAKFGKSFQDIAKEIAGAAGAAVPSGGMGMEFAGITSASEVPVQVEGDTATFTIPNNPQPLVMKQRDGKWLVDISAVSGQIVMMAPMMTGLGNAMDELAADVEAGKFATTQEMMMAFGQKMQGMMNPGGG